MLDSYARADILTDYYSFDNGDFIDYLNGRGFYVASASTANYGDTSHSLASSLNMEYLDSLSNEAPKGTTDMTPIYQMVQNNKVLHLLRNQGYEYINLGSPWQMDNHNSYADANFCRRVSMFRLTLYETTMLTILPSGLQRLGLAADYRSFFYDAALYQFRKLAEIAANAGNPDTPVFVFAHVSIPHPPCVFKDDGTFLSQQEATGRTDSANYLSQLGGCNELVKKAVDDILSGYSSADTPPVIIIQADHGPWSSCMSDYSNLSPEDQTRVVMSIFNAYLLPGGGNELLYDSVTPVNTFRLVFNFYLHSNFALLDDRNYRSPFGRPYEFEEVTDLLAS